MTSTSPTKKVTRRPPRASLGTRGGAMVEYIMLVGIVALLAISGFRQARQRENLVVARQAAIVASLESPPPGFVEVGDYLCTDTYCVPGSGLCFGAGTPVLTEEGLRPIETVREGERVWSRDEHTGAVDLRAVLKRFVTPAQAAISLSVATSDGGELLRVTSGHRFWVTGQGWVPAVELTADQSLWSPSGEPLHVAPIDAAETSYETVYNFEVADFHTYFVGRHGLLVHNAGPSDPSSPSGSGPCQQGGDTGASPAGTPTIGMNGRVLSADEAREFAAFADRARSAGLQPSPFRTGSWGTISADGRYHEVTRIDVAEPGKPGWRGQTHMHVSGQNGHLPLTTKIPGEP